MVVPLGRSESGRCRRLVVVRDSASATTSSDVVVASSDDQLSPHGPRPSIAFTEANCGRELMTCERPEKASTHPKRA